MNRLLIPENDEQNPLLSIVVPALNEEISIGLFIDWCLEGIRRINVKTEILIVDSSSDKTSEIAVSKGARVLLTPKLGLGRAYLDAIPFIRGKWILMGDCDGTYDFRELTEWVQRFEEGYQFIMGSRFKGAIEKGAMPGLHRYFGVPITTFLLNLIHGSCFSDAQCGMRGITKDALNELSLKCHKWSYAPEMIIKAIRLNLKSIEIPISFFKSPQGRVSHLKGGGGLEAWRAGIQSLRVIFGF